MRLPLALMAILGRERLAEMLAASYARVKNVDLNEAYLRLEPAMRQLALISGLQEATWEALRESKPEWDEATLLARLERKLAKSKRFKAAQVNARDEGPWLAWCFLVDKGAGILSGEGLDLLETPDGQKLLLKGFRLAGQHLAKELLR